jgi:hypothetical protein
LPVPETHDDESSPLVHGTADVEDIELVLAPPAAAADL